MGNPLKPTCSLQLTRTVAWLVLAAVSFIFGTTAQAETEEKRFGQEVIEILREAGKIDDERYEELKKKEEAEHAAATQARNAKDPGGYSFNYSNGLQFMRNDGRVKIKFGGRIQADFASIHVDGNLTNATIVGPPPPLPPLTIGGDGEGVEFRRTRLYVSGDLHDRIIFKSQFDFAGGDVDLKDMYIGMKNIPYLGTIKIGHMKEPFSLEEITSSKYITFMERSLPSVFDSARNFGVIFNNHYFDQRMTASAGIFVPTDDGGEFFSQKTDFNISGRLTGLP